MAYRCQKNFFRKSKLNLKTPLAYRCHKNFFRKSKLNLKAPLAYRCHWPIAAIDQYALRSEKGIFCFSRVEALSTHMFSKWKNSRDETK
jgi:hypothetical protein